MTTPNQSYIHYRIGDDGEWEQCRTIEWPPYRAARQTIDMIADAIERTRHLSPADREIEFERVLAIVEKL